MLGELSGTKLGGIGLTDVSRVKLRAWIVRPREARTGIVRPRAILTKGLMARVPTLSASDDGPFVDSDAANIHIVVASAVPD